MEKEQFTMTRITVTDRDRLQKLARTAKRSSTKQLSIMIDEAEKKQARAEKKFGVIDPKPLERRDAYHVEGVE